MVETGLSTVRHLWFGLRALAFLRVDPARQRAIGPEPVIVVVLLILADIALSIFKVEDVQLTALGVSATLAYVALLTAGLLLIGARKRGIDLASMIATLTAMALFGTLLLAAAGAVGTPLFEATGVSANTRAWITAIASSGWLAAYFAALWLYGARATQIDPRRLDRKSVV